MGSRHGRLPYFRTAVCGVAGFAMCGALLEPNCGGTQEPNPGPACGVLRSRWSPARPEERCLSGGSSRSSCGRQWMSDVPAGAKLCTRQATAPSRAEWTHLKNLCDEPSYCLDRESPWVARRSSLRSVSRHGRHRILSDGSAPPLIRDLRLQKAVIIAITRSILSESEDVALCCVECACGSNSLGVRWQVR